jgi:hypothetical protein
MVEIKKSAGMRKLILPVIILLVLVSTLLWYVNSPLNTWRWKEFSSPNFAFQLKYPTVWYLSILDDSSTIQIKNTPIDPKTFVKQNTNKEIGSYSEFYIQCDSLPKSDTSLSAKEYILKQEQDFTILEKQRCVSKNPCIPTTPGFTQKYIGDATKIFSQSNISAVEVQFYHLAPDYGFDKDLLTKKEYVLIANHKTVCTVDLIYPIVFPVQYAGNLEIINKIARSLNFK